MKPTCLIFTKVFLAVLGFLLWSFSGPKHKQILTTFLFVLLSIIPAFAQNDLLGGDWINNYYYYPLIHKNKIKSVEEMVIRNDTDSSFYKYREFDTSGYIVYLKRQELIEEYTYYHNYSYCIIFSKRNYAGLSYRNNSDISYVFLDSQGVSKKTYKIGQSFNERGNEIEFRHELTEHTEDSLFKIEKTTRYNSVLRDRFGDTIINYPSNNTQRITYYKKYLGTENDVFSSLKREYFFYSFTIKSLVKTGETGDYIVKDTTDISGSIDNLQPKYYCYGLVATYDFTPYGYYQGRGRTVVVYDTSGNLILRSFENFSYEEKQIIVFLFKYNDNKSLSEVRKYYIRPISYSDLFSFECDSIEDYNHITSFIEQEWNRHYKRYKFNENNRLIKTEEGGSTIFSATYNEYNLPVERVFISNLPYSTIKYRYNYLKFEDHEPKY
jgi:hypothetical protein